MESEDGGSLLVHASHSQVVGRSVNNSGINVESQSFLFPFQMLTVYLDLLMYNAAIISK